MGLVVSLFDDLGEILHIIVRVLFLAAMVCLVAAVFLVLVCIPFCLYHRQKKHTASTYGDAALIAARGGSASRGRDAEFYVHAAKSQKKQEQRELVGNVAKAAAVV